VKQTYRFHHLLQHAFILVSFLSLVFVPAAFAQEPIAAYPPLPPGYKSIRVFDNQGRFVGRILPAKRYWSGIDQIPVFLQQALIAIEDARFYEHGGIDIRGIARALVKDVMKGRMVEGGSTITQQLVKNKHFSGEKTIERKVREGMMAMEYEEKYTKKQILEMYFNEVYFGNGAWGIAQAALLYFDKPPQELNELECVLLAATPKAPTRCNPLGDQKRLAKRKNLILDNMVKLGMISPQKAKQLRSRTATVIRPGEAPYYLAHVRYKLNELFGPGIIEQGGLDVISAMDLPLQRLAEKTLKDGVRRLSPDLQGALLALDPNTGNVLAAVGGIDFDKNPYDRAFIAKRQPGSAIKPLIYAAALEQGFTAGDIFNDTPVTYDRGGGNVWPPKNYDHKYHGDQSLREALAYSNNVIAVKLLNEIGVPYFETFAARVGLPLRAPNDLSLALGTDEVSLHDLVAVYAPLAANGVKASPRTILRTFDRHRQSWTETPPAWQTVMSPGVAYVTTQMLKDVLIYGTARGLKNFALKRPAAGKTGTTDDYHDAWFIGYTPQLVTGVWVGHDKPRPGGPGFSGGAVCAPIWVKFMQSALAGKPTLDFPMPDDVIAVSIDPKTHQLATLECPEKKEEYYIAGTEPTRPCSVHTPPADEPPTDERLDQEKPPSNDEDGKSRTLPSTDLMGK
jgi:1A family penicillin-binding protein